MKTIFSDDRIFRYALWREWDLLNFRYCVIIGLNPSTADENLDDPTIRRCIGFAKAWGYGAMCIGNLFAFRATDPKQMMDASDPVGPDNDHYLRTMCKDAGLVVVAWGNHGQHMDRARKVVQILRKPMSCFGLTKSGSPCHPLYLPKTAVLKPFTDRSV